MKPVNIAEIVDVMDMLNDGMEAFYSRLQERVVIFQDGNYYLPSFSSVRIDEERDELIPLPDRYEINDYRSMELFIERTDDETAADWMRNAIRGRGAFRMFRAACERFHLLSDWYAFREQRHAETAVSWCLENGLEYDLSEKYADLYEDDDFYDDADEEYLPDEAVPVKEIIQGEPRFRIAEIRKAALSSVVYMYADGLAEKAEAYGLKKDQDIEEAEEDLEKLLDRGGRIFACAERGRYLGLIALKEEEKRVNIVSIYVRKENRRSGIGRSLLERAEEYASGECGKELCIRMFPHEGSLLSFLKSRGYATLQSVEILKNRENGTERHLNVGNGDFLAGSCEKD